MAGYGQTRTFSETRKSPPKAQCVSRRTVRARRFRPTLHAGRAGWLYSGIDRATKCYALMGFSYSVADLSRGGIWEAGRAMRASWEESPIHRAVERAPNSRRRRGGKCAGVGSDAYVIRPTGAICAITIRNYMPRCRIQSK